MAINSRGQVALMAAMMALGLWVILDPSDTVGRADREVAHFGICVESCGNLAQLLIGCGLTEFSMTPGAITIARRVVKETSAGKMARIAARVLTLGTVDDIERLLQDSFGQRDKSEAETR